MYSIWIKVIDGEYNEETATVNGCRLTVSSDRYAMNWNYRVNDENAVFVYNTKEDAQQDAIRDARSRKPG